MTKLSVPQIKIVNCETGEEIVRNATADEITQIELDAAGAKVRQAQIEAKETAKAAILDRLGLTADEVKLLLG
jgi:hypothetical protein